MFYEGNIYRPPQEANTFLLQITAGCTHNKCRFCGMYRDKKFHLIDEYLVDLNLAEARSAFEDHGIVLRRMFLCDGDVFALSADKLESVINKVRSYFPDCETFTMYAAVRNIKAKSDEDLARLAALGVNDLYIGHESGDNDALLFMYKGHTVADSIEQCARLDAAGITHHSLMVIGLSGAGTAERSGRLAADLVNKIKPGLASFFTLTLRDGSDLNGDVAEGRFNMPSAREMLLEQIVTLENITEPDVYFWASHMFNPYPVQGPVGTYKETMLAYLKKALGN